MDDITKKALVSVRGFLERLTQSEGLSPHQVTEAQMASTVLGYELARADYDAFLLKRVSEAEKALAPSIAEILRKDKPGDVSRDWQERWQAGVGAELAATLSATPRKGERPSSDAEVKAALRVRDFLVSYHEQMDPSVGDGPHATYRGGRTELQDKKERRQIYITAPALETYLRNRFPAERNTRVTDVKRLTGGFSKETYIVTLAKESGAAKFIIRKDGAGLPTGSSVVDEYKAIEQVLPTGVPAPKLLWLEADEQHFGTAYMAVEFVDGEPAHLNIPSDPAGQKRWAENLARVMAMLHTSTQSSEIDVRETIRGDIGSLQRRLKERERSPHPGISFGLSWLIDHLDDLEGRPACRVHGDIGFHNILMRGDDLRVLLDWEFSHYSDPVEDVIYVKPFMDDLGAWDVFLTAYQAQSGFTLDDKAAHYFEVWKSLRNAIACVGSLNSLLLPDVTDVALALAGDVFIPKYEIGILDAIIGNAQAL